MNFWKRTQNQTNLSSNIEDNSGWKIPRKKSFLKIFQKLKVFEFVIWPFVTKKKNFKKIYDFFFCGDFPNAVIVRKVK